MSNFVYKTNNLKEYIIRNKHTEINIGLSNSNNGDLTKLTSKDNIISAEINSDNTYIGRIMLLLPSYKENREIITSHIDLVTRIQRVYEILTNNYVEIETNLDVPKLLTDKLNIGKFDLSELGNNYSNLLYTIGGLVKIAVSFDERLLGRTDSKIKIKNLGKSEYKLETLKMMARDVCEWNYFGFEGFKKENIDPSLILKKL